MRSLRRYWLQFATLAVVVAGLVGLWVVGGRGGSAKPTVALQSPTPKVSAATPTPDTRVADVKAAAMAYVQAFADAQKSGSPDQLDTLTVDGSQARGFAGIPANAVRHTGKTFVVTAIHYAEISVNADVDSASAQISYSAVGYDASWPSLTPLASPRSTPPVTETLNFQLISGRWLVDTVR